MIITSFWGVVIVTCFARAAICQNYVLALSRRSSRIYIKFTVCASTTVNFPYLLSSLLYFARAAICQNCVLALSRRSSRIYIKFTVCASTTVNFPYLLSSLLAQKRTPPCQAASHKRKCKMKKII